MIKITAAILTLLFGSSCTHALDFRNTQGLKSSIEYASLVPEGLSNIDLDGDGERDLVVSGHRTHVNAHGFYATSFYIKTGGDLGIVEIIRDKSKSPSNDFLIITIPFDRENVVSTVRFLKLKGSKSLSLLKVYREIQGTYIDPSDTYFVLYNLEHDEIEGRHLFVKSSMIKARSKYSNAHDALVEIGIN